MHREQKSGIKPWVAGKNTDSVDARIPPARPLSSPSVGGGGGGRGRVIIKLATH